MRLVVVDFDELAEQLGEAIAIYGARPATMHQVAGEVSKALERPRMLPADRLQRAREINVHVAAVRAVGVTTTQLALAGTLLGLADLVVDFLAVQSAHEADDATAHDARVASELLLEAVRP